MRKVTLADLLAAKVEMCGGYADVNNFEFFGIKPIEVDEATRVAVLTDMDVKREESEGEEDCELFDSAYYLFADGEEAEALGHRIGERNFTIFGEVVFEDVDAEE